MAIGLALMGIDGRVKDFGSRARTAVIIALAATAFAHLGVPLYYPQDWTYYVYLFLADGIALVVGAVIVAWFIRVEPQAAAVGEAPAAREDHEP